MIELADILWAQRRIRPFINHTPLIHSPFLSAQTGGDVWLKLENQQPTGSFKVRGALNKISQLSDVEKERGIVAASAGNHALGVAHAVASLGHIQADIFVPENAPDAKINKLGRFPVTVHVAGQTYEAAHQAANGFQMADGGTEISAYDDLDVIIGQGTAALEIMTDLPACDLLLLPVGGGGLIAGVGTAVRHIKPSCHIVGVQPEASPAAQLSFAQNRAIDPYDHAPTIADGLAGGFGAEPFAVLRHNPPEIALASEADLRRAILTLLMEHQLIIEPSGAAAIVPLLTGGVDVVGKTAVCILTGGNLGMDLLQEIVCNE
ncbi:Threonine dehydratase, catabolic @ L-serine dehydratase, (PLP)-dependent [hydrothermal vent metagenome]|uniref:Threonine dehydratase, catabolic @ L-serine dehydratase, (PLP)-dependent n=1 Tax=hydrothermal vent metagenome TaxID=652676 RepID=A0A3B0UYD1_9ZZZZ